MGRKSFRVFLISYDDYADDDHDGNDDDGYIQINGYTDKLSIYLSIDKPTSLYPMYHRKKHLNPTLDTPAVALRKVL